jgi:hypothetical protein
VADGALFGLLTGQRDHLTGLFCRESSRDVLDVEDRLSVLRLRDLPGKRLANR